MGNSCSIARDSAKSPLTWRDRAQFRTAWISVRLCRISRKSRQTSAIRGSSARPVLRRRGEIQGVPARSAEIRRNLHLLGATGRNFAPHGSVVGCVEFPGNPEKFLRFADPPPGRFCGVGARFSENFDRSSEIRRNRHLLGAIGCDFAPHGSSADCVEFPENPDIPPRFAGPSPGRLFAAAARFMGFPTRSAEIRRNRRLHGATRCNVAPHGSVVDCVEFSGNPETSLIRGPAARRLCGAVARFGGNPHLIGRDSVKSPLTWGARVQFPTSWMSGRLCGISRKSCKISAVRGPTARPVLRRRGEIQGAFPPGRPRFGEITTYLGRRGAISHLMDQWPFV